MMSRFQAVYEDVRRWAQTQGIDATERMIDPGKAGEFNGISVVMNISYDVMDQTFYLVHALGSIVRWSVSRDDVQKMFDELRHAKKEMNHNRLERAIESYQTFEVESSEFAVWLLEELRHSDVVPAYTNFMRADLEALTLFHRTGRAPIWQDFFARWNQAVGIGSRQVLPFHPEPIPHFRPIQIETQEILQEQKK